MSNFQKRYDPDAAAPDVRRLAGAWLLRILHDHQVNKRPLNQIGVADLTSFESEGSHRFDLAVFEDLALSLLNGKMPMINAIDPLGVQDNSLEGHSATTTADGSERIGDLELRRLSKQTKWRNHEILLTATEFVTVELLAKRCGDNIDPREIYDSVRGEGFVAGRGPDGYRQNVRTIIKRIRRKFRDADPDFDQVKNSHNIGYRWRNDGALSR